MTDVISRPSCFTGEVNTNPRGSLVSRPVQNLVACRYSTKLAGQCRFLTVTWCKNAMGHGLYVSVDDPSLQHSTCKVELKPWLFWKKQGCKTLHISDKSVDIWWDLGSAKYPKGPEPQEGFYVAVVCDDEIVLLLGDLKKEALKKTKAREPNIEASIALRKEHVFGKGCFLTKTKLTDGANDPYHDVSIELNSSGTKQPDFVIKIDGKVALKVRRLAWKFRGNETVTLSDGLSLQVFWDVHDLLFDFGSGHALFIFKPVLIDSPVRSRNPLTIESNPSPDAPARSRHSPGSVAEFSLMLFAWKLE